MREERIRLRFVAPLRRKAPLTPLTGDVSFLPMEAIGDDGSYECDSVCPAVEITDSGYTYFEQGDVIRARVTPCFENGKGALLSALTGERGFGTTELFVFRPSPRIDARFLYYVTVSKDFADKGTATLYGAHGVRRVDSQFARDYCVWLPPLSTQHAIADYLDRETTQIDVLVKAKRQMVNLLAERRCAAGESLVARAWRAGDGMRLGRMLTEVDERLDEESPPELLSVSIHRGVIPFAEANPDRPPRADELGSYKRCRKDDIVLNRMRAFQGGIGVAPTDGIVSPDYAVLRPVAGTSSGYLHHLMRSPWFVGQMERILRGIGSVGQGNVRTPRVNWDDLRTVVVPSPPSSTQQDLASQLDSILADVWRVHEIVEQQISLISERRQALITAAVTGQLDIPEAA